MSTTSNTIHMQSVKLLVFPEGGVAYWTARVCLCVNTPVLSNQYREKP